MARGWRNPYLLLALLVAGTCLPFINQPFHIDDRIYLEVADNILDQPLYPYDYPAIYEGFEAPDAASHSHLPLTSYYLAAVKVLTASEKEWVFHLAFLLFPMLAAWGMYDLARRFVRFPLAASALLVLSPVFLVLSHTLMTDVPLLSLWILAFSRFFAVIDGSARKRDWVILAASLLGAAFISVTAIVLVFLFASAAVVSGRPARAESRRLLSLLLGLPFVLWFLWFLMAYVHYRRFVLVNTFLHMNQRAAFDWNLAGVKALSFALNLGGLFLLPLLAWVALAWGFRLRVALIVFFAAFVPFYTWVTGWSWPHTLLFALFLSTGVLIVFSLVASVWSQAFQVRGWRIVLLWFAAVLAACLVLSYSGSARYTLPALPVVVLLAIRQLEGRIREEYFLRNLLCLCVLLTGAYSFWIGLGDYRFAQVYPQAASELTARYARPDRVIWITGEWGFRYYMNRAGARTLLQTTTGPQAGDIIIKPFIAMPWVTLYDTEEYADLVEQRHVNPGSRVRLLDFASHAGFYSTGWGLLPFSVKNSERWEWFNVFRVKKPYQGQIPRQTRPW
ncbi:MAG: ArnT family glycosyltransferase [Acidobacteriota bacterium]